VKNSLRGVLLLQLAASAVIYAQSIGAGTINGTVLDPDGDAIPGAKVTLHNPVTNYQQSATTGTTGVFRFTNVPQNSYHLEIQAGGFRTFDQDIQLRSTVPVSLPVKLALASTSTSINVEGGSADLVENVPFAHNDVDTSMLAKLPTTSPGGGLSDEITLTAPGVVADSNGFFHPLGDHAQTSYYVDGQPINDQQSKTFSTQLPDNAFQSIEMITGLAPAQYGDKTSLVVDAVTRSGLGKKPFGSFETTYGSFGNIGEKASLGWGGNKLGDFFVVNSVRTGRFLDTPEFYPMHAVGNNITLFDRLDYQPNTVDAFHLDLFLARNWFQVPDTYDQPNQDQRQKVVSFNIAPGYQHTFGAHALLTVNPWVRRDDVNYHPSADPFADTPATIGQHRTLLNWGTRVELSVVSGRHNLKIGTELKQTRLDENFSLGITDFTFNPVCVDQAGNAAGPSTIVNPANCAAAGFAANPSLLPGLVPFDLTRGGTPLQFSDSGHVNQAAFYVQDAYTLGRLTLQGGLRIDQYNGLSESTSVQPRAGFSYLLKKTGTVLRASYARSTETPYNENLLLSSASGTGGLATNVFGAFASTPLKPGKRNQYNAGLQQAFGKYFVVDGDYFWKFTHNAYDFDVLLNTPIAFPISWNKSKLDGVAARVSTTSIHGFQAYVTLGHTRARYFPPENGGLIFNSPIGGSVFRIDHDQALESTANLRYQRPKNGAWIDFTWRYDSGMVAGAVGTLGDVLALSGAQQAAIGFYCGSQRAGIGNPITSCNAPYGASRVTIPKPGTENDDTNPARIAAHHIFDMSVGHDNIFHTEPYHLTVRFTVQNLANTVALYNFLSTFSGTHFVTPRSVFATVGINF